MSFKPSVHIIATIAAIAIAQKEFSDQNDCMETVRSAIENVLSQRSQRSRSYNRSDRGVFFSYRSDRSNYMDTRL